MITSIVVMLELPDSGYMIHFKKTQSSKFC